MTVKLSSNEASERVGIPVSTVKQWADKLGIGQKNSVGKWSFSDQDLDVLALVRSLRADDCGFETIQRRLTPSADGLRQTAPSDDEREESTAQRRLAPAVDMDQIKSAIIEAVSAQTDLAEKYAHAAHRIGELEATVRHLQGKIEEDTRLLTDGRQGLIDLRAQLEVERAKPWWRKLGWGVGHG